MKSYWMNISDGQGHLELREVDVPVPGPGQVLVKLHAAALNRGELIVGHGLHGKGGSKPAGMEGAGHIAQLGSDTGAWQVGDRVMGRCPGTFSEYVVMDVREIMPVPDNLSSEQAASIPLTFLVTYDLLVMQGHLQAGQTLLINGVSSGVGVSSLQMAKVLGAKVIGTSGSQAKLDQLKPLGLDLGLCTRAADFHETVLQATEGKGANLVVNTVGGSMFAENMRCMAFQGRMGIVGYVDNTLSATIDLETLHSKRLCLYGVSNKNRTLAQRSEGVAQFAKQILPAFADGRIQPLLDQVFEFDQLLQAKVRMESNQHTGKIVLRIAKPD
ncbi:zinc-binding dehydrogenase [Limnohabitans sp. 15K]|uniref:zinc-binding dehydrogenase n=1 Tax=Limnohabitans sp. 15K TaxID=1100706 RepID=UPI001E3FC5EC|nr:zinc-binding dehydrogenase [Limnohabitans sp. 15K]